MAPVKPELTPLMQQYNAIKKEHADCILFFRLGDFYEMFGEDARTAAPILEVALTKRQTTPMCGIPYHAVNNYISKLIKKGYRVAMCEQIASENAPPSGKTLFDRKVIHTITPGTLIEENLLNARTNNYLAAVNIHLDRKRSGKLNLGIAFADISTGELTASEWTDLPGMPHLASQLFLRAPGEVIVPDTLFNAHPGVKSLFDEHHIPVTPVPVPSFGSVCASLPDTVMTDEITPHRNAFSCVCALTNYIEKTRPPAVNALKTVVYVPSHQCMMLDETAVRNLELLEGISSRSIEGSLLEVLDHTLTHMGARTLRQWLIHPLIDKDRIQTRQKTIGFFIDRPPLRKNIREKLRHISDMERTLNRLITGSSNARDLNQIKNSLMASADIRALMAQPDETVLPNEQRLDPLISRLDPVEDLTKIIAAAIQDTPPLTIKEGDMIRLGYDHDLDALIDAVTHGKDWIAGLEHKERERTGVGNLKIGYTSVFGYYIEVTRSHLAKIPPDYQRRQTLTNAERFITPELKSMEDKILGAQVSAHKHELRIFQEVRARVVSCAHRIQKTAETIAHFDVCISLAEAACRNDYACPEIVDEPGIHITDGRHPVVERTVREKGGFIPNDITLNKESSLWIITGPNMSGKSTFLRQTALIALLAQIGSYVPARRAVLSIIDRIFTRIGATDNLARGESTFMVEMREMAFILNNLTPRSLLILDEIGRGTSTYDGISIAWAVIEFLNRPLTRSALPSAKPLVLFATHYFELTELAGTLPGVKNYNVDVKEWQNRILFLHKIVPGCADRSYGVHVADLAGLPSAITKRAHKILHQLESTSQHNVPSLQTDESAHAQMNLFDQSHPLVAELENIDIDKMTPLSAINIIAEWKERFFKK